MLGFRVEEDVSVKATSAQQSQVPSIMSAVLLNGIMKVQMEVDTAAAHCVISYDMYKKIAAKSDEPLVLEQGSVVMRMADGTPSKSVKGMTSLRITRIEEPNKTGIFPVIVVDGPHALLGRPALSRLWPDLFSNWVKSAKQSLMVESLPVHETRNVIARAGNDDVTANQGECPEATSGARTRAPALKPAAAAAATTTPTSHITSPNLPPHPIGYISQEMGAAHCEKIAFDVFGEVFDGTQGTFEGVKAVVHIKPGHEQYLRVMPPSKIPHGYKFKELYEKELDKFYATGIPVDGVGLKVASQLVAVVSQKDGKLKLRLCVNYKRTLNDHIMDEPYPFPTCNEQLDKLKGEYYSCLDIDGAFNQILNDPKTSSYLAVVTQRGYLIPQRMPFGLKTAPKIFQASMDKLIHGMDGKSPVPSTACVVDDICITGSTPQEHFENLSEMLYRLKAAGIKLNKSKCKFYQPSVKFLGKIIDKDGQRVNPSEVNAIVNMPAPSDKHTLRSFLGHMSYIGRHVADIRLARAPLDALLKADAKFDWSEEHSKAFNKCKSLAGNTATLAHYDAKLPLVLTTDASPVGLGACLAHKVKENGKTYLKPLSYASCSLKPAELNYAQIDREGLAVYWATKHYRQFLYCRHFELHTDCSALTKIFGSKHDLGGAATGRLNRWAAALMEYDFHATHIKGASNKICDNLSRLPVPPPGELKALSPSGVGQPVSSAELARSMSVKHVSSDFLAEEIMDSVSCLAQLPEPTLASVSVCKVLGPPTTAAWDIVPVSVKDVAIATREDKVYSKLLAAVRSGEIDRKDPDLKPFTSLFYDLHVEQDVIFHGCRIVVPTKQQYNLLFELHMTHPGVVKMKEVARSNFWWPQISKQIESMVRSCAGCNKFRRRPVPAPLCPWPYARRPMERVHIDYFEYKGKMLLIMIDAYSKYIWTHVMNSDTTTTKTLAVLYGWFCERSGFPSTVVSDNGPQFTSKDFTDRMNKWGVKHILTPPYHPASNGLAEKAVGIVKGKLKKMESSTVPVQLHFNLNLLLRIYRATPHSSTRRTPFELISSAPVPQIFPSLQLQQRNQDTLQPKNEFRPTRKFESGDSVLVYNTLTKTNTIGTVKNKKSNNSYIVLIDQSEKHISGDYMRLLSKNCDSVKVNDKNQSVTNNLNNDDQSSDGNYEIEDNESISSDDSELWLPKINFSNRNSVIRQVPNNAAKGIMKRKYRQEYQKLKDNLTREAPPTRTRSGRN